MANPFDQIATLKSELRGKEREIKDLKSGAVFVTLQTSMAHQRRRYEARISRLEKRLLSERKERQREAKGWQTTLVAMLEEQDRAVERAVKGATKDATKQLKKELTSAHKRAREQEARALKAERERDALREENKELTQQLEAKDAENERLKAQIAKLSKNFENSSLPSSLQGPKRKPIPNTRKSTQRRPGAQEGHPHHPRKRPVPQRVVWLEDPKGAGEDPELYPSGAVVSKTLVSASLVVGATEYKARVFRRRSNGSRLHSPFPYGLSDDVTYDASVKALAFLLTQSCATSIAKAASFLKEASKGSLDLSCGMVWKLSREFCEKSEPERRRATESLLLGPSLGADFTCARVGAKDAQVLILANAKSCAMVGKAHKGHRGVEGTALEGYGGCLVHDHDRTFYRYGSSHQECMQHNIRYLVGSIQLEPQLSWNTKMLALIREMLHWKSSLDPACLPPPQELLSRRESFERRYDEILDLASKEYEERPPTKYNREGFNLSKRLKAYKQSELTFLERLEVPPDNSRCERLARVFKRKQHQAICFRSMEGLWLAADALATLENIRNEGEDVFSRTQEIFSR